MFSLGTLIVALWASGCPSINKISDSDSELEHNNLNTNSQIFFMGNLNIYSRPFFVEAITGRGDHEANQIKELTINPLVDRPFFKSQAIERAIIHTHDMSVLPTSNIISIISILVFNGVQGEPL